MLLASAQVIGHRTGRMRGATFPLSARDRREFTLMGQEKLAAACESSLAIFAHLTAENRRLALGRLWASWAASSRVLSLAASRTPAQAIARHAALVRSLGGLTRSSASGATLLQLAERAMRPIHSRATRNARRLSRR
jgi:hypothetical protein